MRLATGIRSSKECLGYELPPANRQQQQQATPYALLPKGTEIAMCRAPRTMRLEMSSMESYAFDYFRNFTVYELPGSTSLLRWDRLVHQASQEEVAVTHAVIALAAMHRAQEPSSSILGPDPDQYHFALSQYNKAVSHLRRYIENLSHQKSESSVEIVLLLSLLFFSFDCFQANDISASTHFMTGLRILCQQHNIVIDDTTERKIQVSIEPRNTMELLTQTFVRLDSDVMLAEDGEPWLQPICGEPIPSTFESINQALVHLDALAGEASTVLGCICREAEKSLAIKLGVSKLEESQLDEETETVLLGPEMHTTSLDHRPDLLDRLEKVRKDLCSWMMAHALYRPTTEEEPLHILANVNFFFWWVQISHVRSNSEMNYDGWLPQFEYITSLIERYLVLVAQQQRRTTASKNRPGLTAGTNMAGCLYDIATRCRSMAVRRRCLNALRDLNMRGTCDGHWFATFIQFQTDWEEQQARAITGDYTTVDLLPGDYPEAARVLDAEAYNEFGDGVKRDDFYKMDIGKIVWAHSPAGGGHAGKIQLEYSFFSIERGQPVIESPDPALLGDGDFDQSLVPWDPDMLLDAWPTAAESRQPGVSFDAQSTPSSCTWSGSGSSRTLSPPAVSLPKEARRAARVFI